MRSPAYFNLPSRSLAIATGAAVCGLLISPDTAAEAQEANPEVYLNAIKVLGSGISAATFDGPRHRLNVEGWMSVAKSPAPSSEDLQRQAWAVVNDPANRQQVLGRAGGNPAEVAPLLDNGIGNCEVTQVAVNEARQAHSEQFYCRIQGQVPTIS